MSIEIDVLNGDKSWPMVEPLMDAVWPKDVVARLPWGHVKWAHADLRVLIDAPEDSQKGGLACHVGIYFRTVTEERARFVKLRCLSAMEPSIRFPVRPRLPSFSDITP